MDQLCLLNDVKMIFFLFYSTCYREREHKRCEDIFLEILNFRKLNLMFTHSLFYCSHINILQKNFSRFTFYLLSHHHPRGSAIFRTVTELSHTCDLPQRCSHTCCIQERRSIPKISLFLLLYLTLTCVKVPIPPGFHFSFLDNGCLGKVYSKFIGHSVSFLKKTKKKKKIPE